VIRRAVAATTAAVALLATAPVHAATVTVTVSGTSFDPAVRTIAPGDRVTFNWVDGPHTVTAYAGDVFDSGARSSGATYSYLYPGGAPVGYRCTLHSTLSEAQECTGMCGLIQEDPVDLLPPSAAIERPTERSVVIPALQGGPLSPVVIEGAAGDNVSVEEVLLRIYDSLGRSSLVGASCTGCGSRVARWSYRATLAPGSYVVEAVAADSSGNLGTSNRRSFFVV
jgi:plastocyanin